MPPQSSHCSIASNLIAERICQNLSNFYDKDEKSKRTESHNILQHESLNALPCVKRVNRAITTYRDHYCRKKSLPKPQNICLPYPAIHFSQDKISTVPTYKDHYPSYSLKDQELNKCEIIPHKHTLTFSKKKFVGKSETKSAFKCPKFEKELPATRNVTSASNGTNRFDKKQPFATHTTYSTQFKKPKKYPEIVAFVPKSVTGSISVSKEPFKCISNYMDEFKVPKVKRSDSGWRFKRHTFKPPPVPMDSKTTYKASFTFKMPTYKPQEKLYPNYQYCKECEQSKRDTEKVKEIEHWNNILNLGDGDKAEQRKMRGHCGCCRQGKFECNTIINKQSDKIYDDSFDLTRGVKRVKQVAVSV